MDEDDITEKILDGLGDDYKELVRAAQAPRHHNHF